MKMNKGEGMITFDTIALASRPAARKIRDEALTLLEKEGQVTFDLTEVLSVSASYADELFGMLYVHLGTQFFKKMEFLGAHSDVLKSIAEAISVREQELNAA